MSIRQKHTNLAEDAQCFHYKRFLLLIEAISRILFRAAKSFADRNLVSRDFPLRGILNSSRTVPIDFAYCCLLPSSLKPHKEVPQFFIFTSVLNFFSFLFTSRLYLCVCRSLVQEIDVATNGFMRAFDRAAICVSCFLYIVTSCYGFRVVGQ